MKEHDEDTPQEKIEKARGEAFPAGVPEDADKGTGRAKGTGLPPGSVGKGHETPQTPPAMSNTPDRTEQEMNEAIGPAVDIPGPYPSGQVSDRGDAGKSAPTKETREAASLGDLTREVSTSIVAEESGGMGSPLYDDEKRKDK